MTLIIKRAIIVDLPTTFGNFQLALYTNNLDKKEHLAIIKGDIDTLDNSLVRIHSECFTGDVLHSLRCDCGDQLRIALMQIEKAQAGIIIYLRQEGRGIGLLNKLRSYQLQQQGIDTYDANIQLGFAADLRDYSIAALILKDLHVSKIKIMTNNPQKISQLEANGIIISSREPLITNPVCENIDYINTKKNKFGHYL
ncbi:MAG: GTP cyclohydrolase II [Bacteroidia bacterium]|nr:MAG: GTP cyclohydrolase II [Bacteroidia bacterium]